MRPAGSSSESGNGSRRSLGRLSLLLLAGLFLGGALGACRPADSDQMTAQREQAIADTLESLTETIDAAWSELEPGPYIAHYSDDAHVYYQGSHLARKQFEKVVRQEMGAHQEYSTTMMDPQVEVLGPDAGVVSFRYEATAVDTAGDSQEVTAAVTAVFERRAGEWKVVQAHESFPPASQE